MGDNFVVDFIKEQEQTKSEPASPLVVGDNQVSVLLKDDLVLVFGWYEHYYLRLLKEKVCVKEWIGSDVLNDLKVKKELLEFVEDFMMPNCKHKECRRLLHNAYYTIATKKSQIRVENHTPSHTTNTSIINGGVKQNENKIILEEQELNTTYQPASGIYQNHAYFGIMTPAKEYTYDKEGNPTGIKKVLKLAWITDDHLGKQITQSYQKDNNITINGTMTIDQPRWSFPNIKEWLEGRTITNTELTDKEIFNKIKEQFKKYVYFDDEQYYNVLPLWIIGTYMANLFQSYPYINLWGLKNTGKTKVMQLSSILSFNSQMFINMSVAALFRIIEQDNPTLFIDEAENLWQPNQKGNDDTSDVVACLNAGWMKGSKVPRVEKEDGNMIIHKFNVYCPKMLASIKGLKGALDTRCIKVIMVRPQMQASSQLWMEDDDKDLLALRDELYCFALRNWSLIKAFYNGSCEVKNSFKLDNRDWQIWKPLLAIASFFNTELVKELGEWAYDECEFNKEDEMNEESWDTKVFKALAGLVQSDDYIRYSMAQIKEAVDKEFIEKSYFNNYTNKDEVTYKKERPSSSYIGKLMNKVGFKKHKAWGAVQGRCYWLSKKIVAHILLGCHSGIGSVASVGSINVLVLGFVKELGDYPRIKEECDKKGISEDELQKALTHLLSTGDIFQPKPDHYEVLK